MAIRLGWVGMFGPAIIRKLGTYFTQRPGLEFIAGANTTVNVADDGVEAITVTIASTGGGGPTPTGTGLRKVASGVEAGAAALLVDADVAAGAAIALSKQKAPTGSGFATVTAGAWDAAALAQPLPVAKGGTGTASALTTGEIVVGGFTTASGVKAGANYLSIGTAASIGNVRLPVGGTIYGLGPGAADALLMRYGFGGGYLLEIGEASLVGEARISATTTGSITGFLGATSLFNFSGNATYLATYGLGNFLQCQTAYSTVEFLQAVSGSFTSLIPFKWKTTTQAGAPTSVTASAAVFWGPMITVTTGTAVAAFKLILPLIDGAEWTVINTTAFLLTVGGATGAVVTIAAGTASKVLNNGTNFYKCT